VKEQLAGDREYDLQLAACSWQLAGDREYNWQQAAGSWQGTGWNTAGSVQLAAASVLRTRG